MAPYRTPVLVSDHLGKKILTGTMSFGEIAEQVKGGSLAINPNAQRSIGKDPKKSTEYLKATDGLNSVPRVRAFCKFMDRVVDNLDRSDISEGFLGGIQLTVDEKDSEAVTIQLAKHEESLPNSVDRVFDNLGKGQHLAIMKASPGFGQPYAQIGDGQGRCIGLYHWISQIGHQKSALLKMIQKKLTKNEDTTENEKELKRLEEREAKIQKLFDESRVPFVLYIKSFEEDGGSIEGLNENSQKRIYVEGNALNSQATVEQYIKFDGYSPVIKDLMELRSRLDWMSPDLIEEDSKSIASSNTNIFTLTALVKSHSWAILNHDKPIEKADDKMQWNVDNRSKFTSDFWKQVGLLFEPTWTKYADQDKTNRIEYLKEQREIKRNIIFQNVFLQALGQVCFKLGDEVAWDPNYDLSFLTKLSRVNFEAFNANTNQWNHEWTDALMKKSSAFDQDGRYVFNNVSDSITKTRDIIIKYLDPYSLTIGLN